MFGGHPCVSYLPHLQVALHPAAYGLNNDHAGTFWQTISAAIN